MTDQFNPTKPFRTRGGLEARIYATDGGGSFPIHGAVKEQDEERWQLESWTQCGHQQQYPGYTGGIRDLVNIIPDAVEFINIYSEGVGDPDGNNSRQQADRSAGPRRIAVLKITIRDGRDVSVEVERV